MRGLPGALSTDHIILKGLPGAQGAPTKIALSITSDAINASLSVYFFIYLAFTFTYKQAITQRGQKEFYSILQFNVELFPYNILVILRRQPSSGD